MRSTGHCGGTCSLPCRCCRGRRRPARCAIRTARPCRCRRGTRVTGARARCRRRPSTPATGLPCRSTTLPRSVCPGRRRNSSAGWSSGWIGRRSGANPSARTVTTDAPGGQFSTTNSPRPSVIAGSGSPPNMSPTRTLAPATGLPWPSSTRPLTVKPFLRTVTASRSRDGGPPLWRNPGARTWTFMSVSPAGASSNRQRPRSSVRVSARPV